MEKRRELPEGTEVVAVCVPDNAGRLIGKRLPAHRWADILGRGLPMPNYHLVTGIENRPQEGFEVTGTHLGYPNGLLRPCVETLRAVPWEPGTAIVISNVQDAAGRRVEQAPRTILQRQIERLAGIGVTATFASELEFYLFRGSYAEARARAVRLPAPSYHLHADNDLLIAGYDEDFVSDVRRAMAVLEIPIDATQGEGGEGQHEINIRHTDPLRMADSHVYYKHAVKAIAHRRGQAATFMAKISSDAPGSSCHVHLCLYGSDGEPAFGVDDLSPLGRSFLAGLLAYTPELTVLHAPSANSYRRLRPGSFAPSNATWGWDNRSCLVRVVGRGEACRFEFRVPGADVNPYHSFSSIIAAGLAGAEGGLRPPGPVAGDAYAQAGATSLPTDLTEALAAFTASEVAARAFGPAVHRHLATLGEREREAGLFAVTDWELGRGLENA
jgi:glutamine synthetase